MRKILSILLAMIFLLSWGNVRADTLISIENSGFEEGSIHNIAAWEKYDWKDRKGISEFMLDSEVKHSGKASLLINSNYTNDARATQKIKVKPDTYYKISCWAKTENVPNDALGANISIKGITESSHDLKDSSTEWEYMVLYGKTSGSQEDMILTLGLGGYNNLNSGKAWFDDVQIEELDDKPSGVHISSLYPESDNKKSTSKGDNSVILFFAGIAGLCILALLFFIIKMNILSYKQNKHANKYEYTDEHFSYKSYRLIDKMDIIIISVLTLIYFFIAIYRLGSTDVPRTYWESDIEGQSFVIDIGKETDVSKICFYVGLGGGEYKLEYMDKNGQYAPVGTLKKDEITDLYAWKYKDVDIRTGKIRISDFTSKAELFEIGVFSKGSEVPIKGMKIYDENNKEQQDKYIRNIIDEQDTVKLNSSFMKDMYFDEVYHARTAYEYIKNYEPYEITHPPLGKLFISLGILIFGMNPFGWRVMGMMAGVAMLPVMYLFGKKIFKSRFPAFCCAFFMMFDFMHFTQTRIATIDSYVTLFIILMYYFMYDYYSNLSYKLGFKRAMICLLLCGIFFGLASSSKWIGIYGGAGLALILLCTKFKEYFDYIKASKKINKKIQKVIKKPAWIKNYVPLHINMTIICCIIFFVIIPALIYALSYIPTMTEKTNGIGSIINNQIYMYEYHAKGVLSATHAYSSKWWSWPVIYKPIWYYGKDLGNGLRSSIVAMGNPMIWWFGIPAFAAAAIISIVKRDRRMVPVFIAALLQYAPWIFVKRITFIYHYFSTVPFIIICIVYVINYLYRINTRYIILKSFIKYSIYIYMAITVIMFIMFYPVLSGMEVSSSYIDNYLRWFKQWVF